MSASQVPVSSQSGLHRNLEAIVRRHLSSVWRQPIRSHSRRAFDAVSARVAGAGALVLDSGCGTAHSTLVLASRHPEALVIGIDKSASRLARAPRLPDNAIIVRAELADFWRLARAAQWPVSHHYLLYPNPWPKPAHLKRRWHGHPVFPDLLALGGHLELRTNFELYAREFVRALEIAGVVDSKVVSFAGQQPVSPFERKYADSGQVLFELTADL
ncbi:MAG: SAM-dependent methyltransferase [Wenzhouxiangella sp.]